MTLDARPHLADPVLERFLRLLGVPRRPPDLGALRELVGAYVARVPFENVSKIYRWRRSGRAAVPDVSEFLDGLEGLGFGGTCYANNYHLYSLLASLDFDVTLCGADMREPDVHMAVLAEVEGRELLLDAGYAAPFLEPLPRDLAVDHVVAIGRDRYVLRPRDAAGRSRLDLYRDGALKHSYVVKPAPRKLEDFRAPIADSYRPGSTFLNALLLARFRPGAALYIHNLTVIEADAAGSSSRSLRDRDELVAETGKQFGIPAKIVREVLEALGSLRDAWG